MAPPAPKKLGGAKFSNFSALERIFSYENCINLFRIPKNVKEL
jgi:hypothetical protein